VVLLLIVTILTGCATDDPGGAQFRPTAEQVYERWVDKIAASVNVYSQAWFKAAENLHELSQGGTLEAGSIGPEITRITDAARGLASGMAAHPYPGGPPLHATFTTDFSLLLDDLDRAAQDWFDCTTDCHEELDGTLLTAGDLEAVVVALASYDRLASPLSSRRHRLGAGLLGPASLGTGWTASDLDLSDYSRLCQLHDEADSPGPTEVAVVSLFDPGPHTILQQRITRFADPDTAAQYLNALRLEAPLCRHRPVRDGASSRDSWSVVTPSWTSPFPTLGLPLGRVFEHGRGRRHRTGARPGTGGGGGRTRPGWGCCWLTRRLPAVLAPGGLPVALASSHRLAPKRGSHPVTR
jgi:hypothetical protein